MSGDWIKYAELGIAALIPIMTLVVGIIVLRLGTKLDATKQLQSELLRKRLALFEDVAPKLNDIFCFFQVVGHWADLDPDEIIKRKRAVDRVIQVNRYLFRAGFWEAYQVSRQRISICSRRSDSLRNCGWTCPTSGLGSGATSRTSGRRSFPKRLVITSSRANSTTR
jgi:hypothetical protein